MAQINRPLILAVLGIVLLAAISLAVVRWLRQDPGTACDLDKMTLLDCDIITARRVVDASKPPWSAIGRVVSRGGSNSHCTGTLIGEAIVLTAAHCIRNAKRGQWAKPGDIIFEAGYQDGKSVGKSAVESYLVGRFYEAGRSKSEVERSRDWAVLTLKGPIGKRTGFLKLFSVAESNPKALAEGTLTVAGYVRLASDKLRIDSDCVMKESQLADPGYVIFWNCPMMSGDSGGPLLVNDGMELSVLGVNNHIFWENGEMYGIATIPAMSNSKRQSRR